MASEHADEVQTIRQYAIPSISLVVVTFYPFVDWVSQNPDAPIADALAYMDIGGPAMVRSAIKSHDTTTVTC